MSEDFDVGPSAAPLTEYAEGRVRFLAPAAEVPNRRMAAFYNPVMRRQRDIAIAVAAAHGEVQRCADPLCGTGVRALRLLRELPTRPFVQASDANPGAVALARENFRRAGVADGEYSLAHEDAALSLLAGGQFDYIDLDPFGSPVPFLDAACRRLYRTGIIGMTATDTAALGGVSGRACMRRYWAVPLRVRFHREVAARILIRRVQLAATTHRRAVFPVLVHSEQHYLRVYVRATQRMPDIDGILDSHQMMGACRECGRHEVTRERNLACPECGQAMKMGGPMWVGRMWDQGLLGRMQAQRIIDDPLIDRLAEEAQVGAVGVYGLADISQRLRCSTPGWEAVRDRLKGRGFETVRSHFVEAGVRTTAPYEELAEAVRAAAPQ